MCIRNIQSEFRAHPLSNTLFVGKMLYFSCIPLILSTRFFLLPKGQQISTLAFSALSLTGLFVPLFLNSLDQEKKGGAYINLNDKHKWKYVHLFLTLSFLIGGFSLINTLSSNSLRHFDFVSIKLMNAIAPIYKYVLFFLAIKTGYTIITQFLAPSLGRAIKQQTDQCLKKN